MKHLLTFCLLLATQFVAAQANDKQAVINTERQRFDAQIAKDYAVLDRVLADDLLYAHASGNTDTKQSYIQSIRDGKSTYGTVDIVEQTVRVYGNAALINGICLIKTPGKDDLKLRYTDAYVKKNGQWQLVTWQSLKMPQ